MTNTLSLTAVQPAGPWNQKQAIKRYLSNYPTKFDMEGDAIDLRTMAHNYPSGIIPLEDIHQGLLSVLGPNCDPNKHQPYDPSVDYAGGVLATGGSLSPKFTYVNWGDLYLYSIFQRDVAPNHINKLKKDWDHTSVLIPCAIKFTLNGVVYYCLWDGHHTVQTARIMNYTKFPVWFIDIDAVAANVITAAGFPDTEAGRVDYGCWIAGHNMIRINDTNKRPLSHYDKYMIMYETKDAKAVAIDRILTATGCVAKRSAKIPGAWTQINSGIECYNLLQANGMPSNGMFWRHSLEFHRHVWKLAPLVLEIFRPMSYLYQAFAVGNYAIDAQFDIEMENILTAPGMGSPEDAQKYIKDSYEAAILNNTGRGRLLKNDREIVYNGLINLYNQRCGRLGVIPQAEYVWTV